MLAVPVLPQDGTEAVWLVVLLVQIRPGKATQLGMLPMVTLLHKPLIRWAPPAPRQPRALVIIVVTQRHAMPETVQLICMVEHVTVQVVVEQTISVLP